VGEQAVADLLEQAEEIARRRRLRLGVEHGEYHAAVRADDRLTEVLAAAVQAVGVPPKRMVSGAGHDAAIMAALAPISLLFLRSPGGVSHHPDEAVFPEDVRIALQVILNFLLRLGDAR